MSTSPAVTSRTVEVRGVLLPYVKYHEVRKYPYDHDTGEREWNFWAPYPPERGDVFVTFELLYEVAEQGAMDSHWEGGRALIVSSPRERCALEQAGWCVVETRGGVHGTDALRAWLKENDLV